MHAAAANAVLSPVVGELALRIVGDRDQPLAKATGLGAASSSCSSSWARSASSL